MGGWFNKNIPMHGFCIFVHFMNSCQYPDDSESRDQAAKYTHLGEDRQNQCRGHGSINTDQWCNLYETAMSVSV